MLSNYFTLHHLAHDLHHQLTGTSLESVFSQNKNEIVLSTAAGALLISCGPTSNHLFLRSSFPRAKKNTLDFFSPLHGATVRSVRLHSSDRELTIETNRPELLLVRMYGSKANVLLVNAHRKILGAFLRSKELVGSSAEEGSTPRIFPASAEEFLTQLTSIGHLTAFATMKTLVPLLGPLLVRELFVRAGIDEMATAIEIRPPQATRLFEETRGLIDTLTTTCQPRIYRDGHRPIRFAILRLRHLSHLEEEEFESIHEALRTFIATSHKDKDFQADRDQAFARLRAEKGRIERTMAKITEEERESAERASASELWGKLIMAHLHLLKRGLDVARLENVLSPKREVVEVSLDLHLTPAKNAERYFNRARKARESLAEQAQHRQEYHDGYERVVRLLAALEQVQTAEQWKEFEEAHGDSLGRGKRGSKSTPVKEQVPFRVFAVDGGFEVWAGKSSENNDLLTMKFTRPNDLWFHARGSSGSHVVLRLGTGKGEVSRRAIEQAASIAAYYSKMKGARLVPVAMTEKKYVRKPKGAPAGTVTIDREKTIMVEPKLPA